MMSRSKVPMVKFINQDDLDFMAAMIRDRQANRVAPVEEAQLIMKDDKSRNRDWSFRYDRCE